MQYGKLTLDFHGEVFIDNSENEKGFYAQNFGKGKIIRLVKLSRFTYWRHKLGSVLVTMRKKQAAYFLKKSVLNFFSNGLKNYVIEVVFS